MHLIHSQLSQTIEIILLHTGTITSKECERLNSEVINNTIDTVGPYITTEKLIAAFNTEYDKYRIANGIKLPNSEEPNKKYYYAMLPEEDVDEDAMFHVVSKEYFDTNKCVDDRHIMDALLSNLEFANSFETEFYETAESLFESTSMGRKDTLKYLSNITNFIHNPSIL